MCKPSASISERRSYSEWNRLFWTREEERKLDPHTSWNCCRSDERLAPPQALCLKTDSVFMRTNCSHFHRSVFLMQLEWQKWKTSAVMTQSQDWQFLISFWIRCKSCCLCEWLKCNHGTPHPSLPPTKHLFFEQNQNKIVIGMVLFAFDELQTLLLMWMVVQYVDYQGFSLLFQPHLMSLIISFRCGAWCH